MPESSPAEEHLQERLGYRFADPRLLRTALTHRSAAHEAGLSESYERLEFLGDAVLGLVASEWLFRRYPDEPEGELTRLRIRLVSATMLAQHATRLGVGPCLQLGHGEEHTGGREKASLLADALEAVLGALFLDAGYRRARAIIESLFNDSDAEVRHLLALAEAKNRLQEALQAAGHELPSYAIRAESGPDHEKHFEVEVRVADEVMGEGSGSSKKVAEQRAAQSAIRRLPARGQRRTSD